MTLLVLTTRLQVHYVCDFAHCAIHKEIADHYYMSTGTFEAKFMLACLLDAMRQFSSFGFKVSLLIVDGASSNLSALKLLMGVRGTFCHDDQQEDRHRIAACIPNPFTGQNMYLLICPSHQVLVSSGVTSM